MQYEDLIALAQKKLIGNFVIHLEFDKEGQFNRIEITNDSDQYGEKTLVSGATADCVAFLESLPVLPNNCPLCGHKWAYTGWYDHALGCFRDRSDIEVRGQHEEIYVSFEESLILVLKNGYLETQKYASFGVGARYFSDLCKRMFNNDVDSWIPF